MSTAQQQQQQQPEQQLQAVEFSSAVLAASPSSAPQGGTTTSAQAHAAAPAAASDDAQPQQQPQQPQDNNAEELPSPWRELRAALAAISAFLFSLLSSVQRLPAWVQAQQLRKLRDLSEEDPRDANKHAAYLAELNKVQPKEVLARVESKEVRQRAFRNCARSQHRSCRLLLRMRARARGSRHPAALPRPRSTPPTRPW